jgi:hypothetical protein
MNDEHFAGMTGDLWDAWVDLNYRVCRDTSIHGAVEHVLGVGRKR